MRSSSGPDFLHQAILAVFVLTLAAAGGGCGKVAKRSGGAGSQAATTNASGTGNGAGGPIDSEAKARRAPFEVPVITEMKIPDAATLAGYERLDVDPTNYLAAFKRLQASTTLSRGLRIVMAKGTYRAPDSLWLKANGTPTRPILIQAADPSDRPVWDGQDVKRRDCIQVWGDNYRFDGLVFENCRFRSKASGGSSSAIRAINSANLTIANSEFRTGFFGISGAAESFVIRDSYVHDNFDHAIYVYGGTLEITGTVVRNSGDKRVKLADEDGRAIDPTRIAIKGGQLFHVRTRWARIANNWFSGPRSYLGDLMTCEEVCGSGESARHQVMILEGNLLDARFASLAGFPAGDVVSPNTNHVVALYDDEGGGRAFHLLMNANTVIGHGFADGKTTKLVKLAQGRTNTVAIHHNVIVGVDQLIDAEGVAASRMSVTDGKNFRDSAASPMDPIGPDLRPSLAVGPADSASPKLEFAAGSRKITVPAARQEQELYGRKDVADQLGYLAQIDSVDSTGPGDVKDGIPDPSRPDSERRAMLPKLGPRGNPAAMGAFDY